MTRPIIRLKEGDHRKVRVGLKHANGAARNPTNETIEFRAAPTLGAVAATISKTDGAGIEVIDAVLGLIDIVFEPSDTENAPPVLLWELRITDIAGEELTLDFGTDSAAPQTYGVLLIERALERAG